MKRINDLLKRLRTKIFGVQRPNRQITEIAACIDCICYLANNEIPEDRPELPAAITKNWPPAEYDLSVGQGDDLWFSWSGCECCNSDLGGTRETVFACSLETA